MRSVRSCSRAPLAALLIALAAPAALAESNGHVYAGSSLISGEADDQVTDGWMIGFGGIVNDDGGPMGWRWDFGYDRHDAREGTYNSLLVDDGDISTWFVRLGPQWTFEGYDSNFYVGLHVGYYWTYANLSQYATVPGYICDPFWGYCYVAAFPGEYILADRSSNDWGASGTIGYEWATGGGTWFIEAQYHVAEHGEGYEFAPVVIGLRF